MDQKDFQFYQDTLKAKSGLTITSDKSYLLDSRLSPVAKKWEYDSLESMTNALRQTPNPSLITDVVEAMTTNETSFFRDTTPFDIFKNVVIPHFQKTRAIKKSIRIWCAASSTGQEPYSLAMTIKEMGTLLTGWKIDIVATDISNEALNTAKEGVYSQFEVQRGLPIQMLMKYFEQDGERWKIVPDIKNMIEYKYFNLLENMAPLGGFDIVFCRNVLIYFDKETKGNVLNNISNLLSDDGFLFLGGAETVLGITDSFEGMKGQRGLYVKPGNNDASNDVLAASGT